MASLKNLSKDIVPNVRLNVAKTCQVLLKAKTSYSNEVNAIISSMANDSDRDVKYFSQNSLW